MGFVDASFVRRRVSLKWFKLKYSGEYYCEFETLPNILVNATATSFVNNVADSAVKIYLNSLVHTL